MEFVMRLQLSLVALLIVYVVGIVIILTPYPPANDDYAAYALGINLHGVYGLATNDEAAPFPSMGRAPLYPVFLSIFITLDESYKEYLLCYYADASDCSVVPDTPRIGQMILGLLTVFPLFSTARMLGAHDRFTALMVLILMIQYLPWIYLYGVSESVSLPLHALLTYFTARYLFKETPNRDALLVGLTLGLLALSRFAYQYYLPLLLIILIVRHFNWQRFEWQRMGVALLLGAFGFGLLVAPWLTRNQTEFGVTALGTSGSTGVITARAFYNRMNSTEYATAFLYWLPFIGDNVAERILPESYWARLDTDNPDGFRLQSRQFRQEQYREGITESEIRSMMMNEILDNWPAHMALSLPFAVRGLRNATFFLPLMPIFFYYVIRSRLWRQFLTLSAGWFVLVFHAGATHFNVRYGWPLAFDFALAAALAATLLWKGIQRRQIERHEQPATA